MMGISEDILNTIKTTPKIIIPKQQGSTIQKGNKQWNFDVEFEETDFLKTDSLDLSLTVFARQNNNDPKNFSCGVSMTLDSKRMILSRYNGSNHQNDVAHYECHIHHATSGSINRGDRKPEHENTQVTDRYANVNDAFKCLCEDYKIRCQNEPQSDLFGRILV